jgi:hypothetical protein
VAGGADGADEAAGAAGVEDAPTTEGARA